MSGVDDDFERWSRDKADVLIALPVAQRLVALANDPKISHLREEDRLRVLNSIPDGERQGETIASLEADLKGLLDRVSSLKTAGTPAPPPPGGDKTKDDASPPPAPPKSTAEPRAPQPPSPSRVKPRKAKTNAGWFFKLVRDLPPWAQPFGDWYYRNRPLSHAIPSAVLITVIAGGLYLAQMVAGAIGDFFDASPSPPVAWCDQTQPMTSWDQCRFVTRDGLSWSAYANGLGMNANDLKRANPPLAAMMPDILQAGHPIMIKRP